MPSSQSQSDDRDQQVRLWLSLVDNLADQLDSSPQFLEQECDNLELPPPDRVLSLLRRADPHKSLELLKDKNPDLDLSKASPLKLAQALLVTAADLQ